MAPLCARLASCEWAGKQLLALARSLQRQLPALASLDEGGAMPSALRACDAACEDLVHYISAQQVFLRLAHKHRQTAVPAPASGAAPPLRRV